MDLTTSGRVEMPVSKAWAGLLAMRWDTLGSDDVDALGCHPRMTKGELASTELSLTNDTINERRGVPRLRWKLEAGTGVGDGSSMVLESSK
jgi:hypothetical protein